MLLCFQIAGEEYCVEIDTRKIARLVVGRYDPGGKDPEVPNAGEDGLKIRWSDGIYVFKNVKCRRGCGPGDTDCAHREHVEITALGDRVAVQTAPGATHPVYYGRAETERNVLKEILLTPGQRLYLWISGVRDAAGRQAPLIIRYATPAPEATCQAACEAWHIIQQLYHRVKKGPLKLTEKEVEDLMHEFNILKGHLDGVITTSPELVEKVKPLEDVVELTALLIKGEIPEEVSTKIVSIQHRLNQVIQLLGCNCERPTASNG